AGDVVEHFPGDIALATEAAGRQDQVVDALVAAYRGLNCVLGRNVGAHAHRGQDVEPFDVVAGAVFGAGYDHPAAAEARQPVRLGEAVERHAQHVVGDFRHRYMLGAVVENLVVDFVGENYQIVVARDLHDL